MALDKNSYQSDKIANLYRAAYYMAKGAKNTALQFIEKSGENFGDINLDSKQDELYWAEKKLDRYKMLK